MIKSVSKTEIKEAVAFAISLKEYRLEDGSFNWDWIEVDVYTKVFGDVSPDERDEDKFDQYFDEVLFEIPPSLRPSYHWDIRKATSWTQENVENLTVFLQN